MSRFSFRSAWAAGLVLVAACGDGGTEPPPGAADCSSPTLVTLAVGQHQVLDATAGNGCLTLPAAGSESVYLMGLVSGSGTVTDNGVSGTYAFRTGAEGAFGGGNPSIGFSEALPRQRLPGLPEQFHRALRQRERVLAADPRNRIQTTLAPRILAPPPVEGSTRDFAVCTNTNCDAFDTVTAVARAVGTHVAVYLDSEVPTADSLRQADLDELQLLFDDYHYTIGTDAFGSESDLDNNDVVIILLTDAVNALTPDCSNGRILGYFYGGDLLDVEGSNHSEVFYAMVPAPSTPTCSAAPRAETLIRLKPTLIHEFQHMISFNQHVLVRNGGVEETWLNEALSHFSEELGGRLIPNERCPGSPSCRSQYVSGDLLNAWDYMSNTEAHHLVMPDESTGTLEERGAGWLFLTWLVDQFGTTPNGSNVTLGLVQTNRVGVTNVTAVTGQTFPTLVGEWFLALYVDDLTGFTPASPRLTFESWGLRTIFLNNCCAPNSPFPTAFPFTPVNATSSNFQRTGTLRGGSGRHFLATIPGGATGIDVLISKAPDGPVLDAALESRIAIVRLQ
ncbi:MAG TPA: hypothetical protein VFO95_07010 [Gemmatimonadales bacterium]|nr:hypothetical protein [Gemmatimonadales bacterium]